MLNPLFNVPRNVLTNYINVFIGVTLNFLLTPFLIYKLGDNAFGIWILVNSMRQYFQLLEFGTNPAIIKLVSEYAAKNDKYRINELASSSLTVFSAVGLLSIVLSQGIARYGVGYMQIPAAYLNTTELLIMIVGVNIFFLIVKRGMHAILTGYHRFDIKNLVSICGEILQALTTVVLLMQGFGLISLALLAVCVNLIEVIFLLYCLVRYYSLKIRFFLVSAKTIREIFNFSVFTFITDLASRIAWNIDVLVIGYFLPVSSVTVYIVGVKLASVIEKLLNPFIHVFFPMASTWGAQKQNKYLQRLMLEGTKISLLFSLPTGVIIFLTGKSLITLWVGEQYLSGFPVLEIFIAVFVISNMESTASQIQLGMGKLRFNTAVCTVSAMINFALSIALVKRYGIIGVAIGTLIPNLISNIIFSIPYTCHILKLSLKKLIVHSFISSFVSLSVPWLLVYGIGQYIDKFSEISRIIILSIMFLFIYLATYLTFFSSKEEKQKIIEFFRSATISLSIGQK